MKEMKVKKTSAIILVCNENKIIVKNLYFNLCLMFDPMAIIYGCYIG